MIVKVYEDKRSLSRAAAGHASAALRRAILDRRRARIKVATGSSQLEFLEALTRPEGIDWQRIEMFHLGEYIGLPVTHPTSFRKYLLERLIHKTGITNYHLLEGDGDPVEVARRVGESLHSVPVDLAFVVFGENGHLAFHDPPADFQTEDSYFIVSLDEACRQQVGEYWFADISDVTPQAISMSLRQILKAKEIILVVPDARKAQAVRLCIEGGISPMTPASVLRTHPATTLYLDRESARLLNPATLAAFAATG